MFVTREITLDAASISQGFQDQLHLDNLDVPRDWKYAKDYVKSMWMILKYDVPEDLATYHTVISFFRLHGISTLEFLKNFFAAIVSGRRDYENFMPITVGIKLNKIKKIKVHFNVFCREGAEKCFVRYYTKIGR